MGSIFALIITIIGLIVMFSGIGWFYSVGFLDWQDSKYEQKFNSGFLGGLSVVLIGAMILVTGVLNL